MGLSQCIGAIDGSHILVSPHTDYYNGTGWYLVLVQAADITFWRFMLDGK